MKQVRVIAITLMLMLISTLVLMLGSVASSTSSEVVISSLGKVSSFDENGTNDYVYLGALLDGKMPDILENWTSETGKGLAIYATFAALAPQSPVSGYYATLIQRLTDALPWMKQGLYSGVCLLWMTTFTCDPPDTGPNGTAFGCIQNVATGQYDDVILENARWIKSNFPYKLILRLNDEFDIPSVWGWGKDPAVYVAAWKRIVDIFRQENVSQVEWCWSPNFNSDAGVVFASYYPGDDYVDWIGVSVYANNWGGWQNASQMLRARGARNQNAVCPYQFALNHHKPFSIAEWGLNVTGDMTDEQNADWLTGLFQFVESNTNIKMMIHWGAYELFLLNYPTAVQVYKSHISAPRYSSHYP